MQVSSRQIKLGKLLFITGVKRYFCPRCFSIAGASIPIAPGVPMPFGWSRTWTDYQNMAWFRICLSQNRVQATHPSPLNDTYYIVYSPQRAGCLIVLPAYCRYMRKHSLSSIFTTKLNISQCLIFITSCKKYFMVGMSKLSQLPVLHIWDDAAQ